MSRLVTLALIAYGVVALAVFVYAPSWLSLAIWLFYGVHWAYVICMAAKRALEDGRLTAYWIALLGPAAGAGVLLDIAFNYTFGLMFAAMPRPFMFSGTVQYWYDHGKGWRLTLARFYARQLNVFDDHIK